MKLSVLDISIVAFYIVAVLVIGFVMKKQAAKNIKQVLTCRILSL